MSDNFMSDKPRLECFLCQRTAIRRVSSLVSNEDSQIIEEAETSAEDRTSSVNRANLVKMLRFIYPASAGLIGFCSQSVIKALRNWRLKQPEAFEHWKELWYCDTCGVVLDLSLRRYAWPSQIKTLYMPLHPATGKHHYCEDESIKLIPFMPTPFTFTYILEEAGWATATWVTEGRTFQFSLSYLGNPLRDLLIALNEMDEWFDEQGNPLPHPSVQNGFDWQGEPWGYRFVFNPREGRNVCLTITYHTDIIPYQTQGLVEMPSEEIWLETVVSLDDLQRQAFAQAEAILRDFGLSGYRLSWIDSDFPISEFLKLRSSLLGISLSYSSLTAEAKYFSSLVSDRG